MSDQVFCFESCHPLVSMALAYHLFFYSAPRRQRKDRSSEDLDQSRQGCSDHQRLSYRETKRAENEDAMNLDILYEMF